jgi:hypothetical protein
MKKMMLATGRGDSLLGGGDGVQGADFECGQEREKLNTEFTEGGAQRALRRTRS